jgi:ribosomal protein S18 acetylase RimI-like enzyme
MAELAASLQRRPEHHVVYLGFDPDTIAAEMLEDVEDWTEASAVAEEGDRLVGWSMGSIDHDMGRVWWFGPFVDTDDPTAWRDVADRLDEVARRGLGPHVTEEEFAFDARHVTGAGWALDRGLRAEPGSAILVLDHIIGPPELETRPVTADDRETVALLHDELFANTHTPGATLVRSTDAHRPRLVAERDGRIAGYVAVERQPDGSGYIDFLGIDPAFRRQGIGSELIRAGVAALAELGCERFHLTVREDNTGARALYAGLGFEEERIIRPFRRGFSLP